MNNTNILSTFIRERSLWEKIAEDIIRPVYYPIIFVIILVTSILLFLYIRKILKRYDPEKEFFC